MYFINGGGGMAALSVFVRTEKFMNILANVCEYGDIANGLKLFVDREDTSIFFLWMTMTK